MKPTSLRSLLARDSLRWSVFSVILSFAVFTPTIVLYMKTTSERDLSVRSLAALQAQRSNILSGNIKRAEQSLRHILNVSEGEVVKVVDTNLKFLYEDAVSPEIRPCRNQLCWGHYGTRLRTLVPIYFDDQNQYRFGSLWIELKPKVDIKLLVALLFGVLLTQVLFVIGYTSGTRRVAGLMADKIDLLLSDLKGKRKEEAASTDILEFRQVGDALHDLNAQLTKLRSHAVDEQTVKQVAHDIRSPLSALKLALKALEVPERTKVLAEMACRRIEAIADDLLRAEASVQRSESHSDLKQIIEEIVAEKRMELSKYQIRNDLAQETSIPITCNRTSIGRIISNLLNNAAEASTPGSVIGIQTYVLGPTARVNITDSGKGIPLQIQELLKRGQTVTTKKFGHGLGLNHAKHFLEENGGKLEVVSKEGVGTQVTITIPIARPATPADIVGA